jgi:hypothetical protein
MMARNSVYRLIPACLLAAAGMAAAGPAQNTDAASCF